MTDELQPASDAERERAVARLRDASTEGRVTLEEPAIAPAGRTRPARSPTSPARRRFSRPS